jgi:hypothetical protein
MNNLTDNQLRDLVQDLDGAVDLLARALKLARDRDDVLGIWPADAAAILKVIKAAADVLHRAPLI